MDQNQTDSQDSSNMKRREFLQLSALGGAMALTGAAVSCSQNISKTKVADFELDEMTIAEIQKGMESGQYSAKKITELYLSRIEEIDRSGPKVNSVLEVNPDAIEIAEALDKERAEKGARGPMHGIPILIKDNIDTADKMTTTAGSHALAGSIALQDSFVAQKLRQAGAIILGKTNLSEWANFRSSRSSSGWSGRGGQTNNPYVLDRNPCGSSSGSAAATAASLCAAAIGTETNGSVVCPSSANSIVGIKPTVGLISRTGIIPIAHSQDTAGPMARTVADAAALLGALTGIDERDDASKQSQGKAHTDYTQFLDPNGLKGMRIGVARNSFGFHEKVDKLMEDAIEVMKQQGAVIIDEAKIETHRQYNPHAFQVLLYEFKADLNKYLAGLSPNVKVKTLKDIIEFNEQNRDIEMPYFEQETFLKAEEKGPLTEKEYLEALETGRRLAGKEGIDATMAKHNLDAIIAPTGGPPWPTDLINGDHFGGGSSSAAAISGYPNITVPAGYIFGLPVGISFFAEAYSDPKLIKITYAFEQATKHRQPPKFLPSIDLTIPEIA